MKYGLIIYSELPKGRKEHTADHGMFNVGDNIQMLCMRRLYLEEMNVKEEDIVEIDFHSLTEYTGEYLIVPINLFFLGCHDAKETWFPASPYIIPVFLGVHFSSCILTENEVNYLTKYAPIGCRDEWTLQTMRKYNIPAYLFGCITATLPRRERNLSQRTTFFVDVNAEKLSKVMPDMLTKKTKIVHHVEKNTFSVEMIEKMDALAEQYLNDYRENAAIVITSRLHCASPCVAMGIPTVMVVKEKSIRYAWLEKLIKIYTEDEIAQIDWNVVPAEYEKQKKMMIKLAKERLEEAKKKYELMYDVSFFFENRNKTNYEMPYQKLFEKFRELMAEEVDEVYFWGGTVLAEDLYYCMHDELKMEMIPTLIDEFNTVSFHGQKSMKFGEVKNQIGDKSLLVATATSAQEAIEAQLRENRIKCRLLKTTGEVIKL